MNKNKKTPGLVSFLIVAAITLISGCTYFMNNGSDQLIKMKDLPAAVKSLVEKETAGCKIKNVEKETRDNRTIYAITYLQDGTEMEIEYTPDGIMIYKGRE